MNGQITITLNFGNSAMSSIEDAGNAILEAGEKIRDGREPSAIWDINGNKVGTIAYDDNARLVAAAPDMLKALQGVLHHNDGLTDEHKISPALIRHVESAIAKAQDD